jgi:hypothetical protein
MKGLAATVVAAVLGSLGLLIVVASPASACTTEVRQAEHPWDTFGSALIGTVLVPPTGTAANHYLDSASWLIRVERVVAGGTLSETIALPNGSCHNVRFRVGSRIALSTSDLEHAGSGNTIAWRIDETGSLYPIRFEYGTGLLPVWVRHIDRVPDFVAYFGLPATDIASDADRRDPMTGASTGDATAILLLAIAGSVAWQRRRRVDANLHS